MLAPFVGCFLGNPLAIHHIFRESDLQNDFG